MARDTGDKGTGRRTPARERKTTARSEPIKDLEARARKGRDVTGGAAAPGSRGLRDARVARGEERGLRLRREEEPLR